MPKIKKKGTSGQAKNFITRTQAVRKLQISLPDFRRLCIFKGIYPREPRNKKKASKSATASTTFYYTKDIQYLLHEPLLQKFRDHKALAKKIGRYLGRGEASDAARLEKTHTPRITLDHIIKERYPTFVDALRDLDDALSMLFLFASLPSTTNIPPKTIALCQRLCLEFEHYLIITHSLRKSFLSIKGIYYQASIQGQDVLWLVPYKFVQRVSGDIDFRIMGTFVEFYTTLLRFVNYRLYTTVGLIYPPKFNAKSDESGGELGAFTLEGRSVNETAQLTNGSSHGDLDSLEASEATERAQNAANLLNNAPTTADRSSPAPSNPDYEGDETSKTEANEIDTFVTATALDADVLPQPGPSSNEAGALFADFTFFLSRETPRAPLEFLVRAFGCKRVAWDAVLGDGAFTNDETDQSITHQVVDRPPIAALNVEGEDGETKSVAPRGRIPGRIYIQPQWVWDCINTGKLLRPDLYAPGAELPPHLSPFVKPKPGAYDPSVPLTQNEGEVEEEDAEDVDDELMEDDGDDDEADGSDEEESDDVDATGGFDALAPGKAAQATEDEDDWDGVASDDEASDRQAELLAESRGEKATKPLKSALKKMSAAEREAREKAEQVERQKLMMPRRKRKLFEKMQYSNARKEEEKQRLENKRRRIEKSK